MDRRVVPVLVGVAAGFLSGLLGIGGGIVMVPLLVGALHLTQHHAHATSLAAIVIIGAGGAFFFGRAGEVDLSVAALLAAGGLAGAPLGAWLMASTPEARLKIAFGVVTVIVGIVMVAT